MCFVHDWTPLHCFMLMLYSLIPSNTSKNCSLFAKEASRLCFYRICHVTKYTAVCSLLIFSFSIFVIVRAGVFLYLMPWLLGCVSRKFSIVWSPSPLLPLGPSLLLLLPPPPPPTPLDSHPNSQEERKTANELKWVDLLYETDVYNDIPVVYSIATTIIFVATY